MAAGTTAVRAAAGEVMPAQEQKPVERPKPAGNPVPAGKLATAMICLAGGPLTGSGLACGAGVLAITATGHHGGRHLAGTGARVIGHVGAGHAGPLGARNRIARSWT